ncbi:hypothetical protein AURDEDRAFT_171187 [Auricularia subglabra TFB-10046 SS5]|uniref:Uncharacterized protein n=1 Tax=Auricularia subglabra (strain TFB-10046 / SS5) TaxID=717982 RepID=J0LJ55_AURST|nr:hypothetical protein AURDEDRAFT_171187 [Auricularia subglabra TFB-10046 SS5]
MMQTLIGTTIFHLESAKETTVHACPASPEFVPGLHFARPALLPAPSELSARRVILPALRRVSRRPVALSVRHPRLPPVEQAPECVTAADATGPPRALVSARRRELRWVPVPMASLRALHIDTALFRVVLALPALEELVLHFPAEAVQPDMLLAATAAPFYSERLHTTHRELTALQTLILVVLGADVSSSLVRQLLSELRDLGLQGILTLLVRGFSEDVVRGMEITPGKTGPKISMLVVWSAVMSKPVSIRKLSLILLHTENDLALE